MLTGTDLRVRRGERWTLDGVNISIKPGVLTAIVGPNGAGKSTLLAALTGLAPLETGLVELDGAPLQTIGRKAIARRVSVLQQQFRSTFPFKAFEIVAMGRSPHQGYESSADAARLIETALAAADVAHLADRPIDRLSGGERQRVFLARALAQILPFPADPSRFLLLDEPTASLDLRHQATTLSFARSIAHQGAGVLCILHDLNLAARFADEVMILHDGAVAAFGSPEAVFTGRVLQSIYGPGLTVFPEPGTGRPVVLPNAPSIGGPLRDEPPLDSPPQDGAGQLPHTVHAEMNR